jgi:hypothetical protein
MGQILAEFPVLIAANDRRWSAVTSFGNGLEAPVDQLRDAAIAAQQLADTRDGASLKSDRRTPDVVGLANLSAQAGQPATVASSGRLANVARIYDFLLGGKDNYEEDRRAGARLLEAVPDAAVAAWDNRRFLGRVVQFLAEEAGIRQFIDIGTGLPTRGSVHAVAHQIAAEARVAYVDNDPVVIAHANALLSGGPNVAAMRGDIRNPKDIITNPALRSLIDFGKPVAVLMVAVLHFIADAERPHDIVGELKSVVAPGSYFVISHVTADEVPFEAAERVRKLYDQANAPGVARSRTDIAEFFEGLEMIRPGLVSVAQWRPERLTRKAGRTIFYAGVGVKK